MAAWQWLLLVIGVMLVVYAAAVAALLIVGRRSDAHELARFIPDCLLLFRALLRDPRVPPGRKALLAVLVAYLAVPIDLVPDFIPVAGQLDDAIVVALVLRSVLRSGGSQLLREHWGGAERSLDIVLRLAGAPA